MNSYENEIMDLLLGNTPKDKYEYLQQLLAKNEFYLAKLKETSMNLSVINDKIIKPCIK